MRWTNFARTSLAGSFFVLALVPNRLWADCCTNPGFTSIDGNTAGIYTEYHTSPRGIASLAISDYNRDGWYDAVAAGNRDLNNRAGYVYKNNGGGNFTLLELPDGGPNNGAAFLPDGSVVGCYADSSLNTTVRKWPYLGNNQFGSSVQIGEGLVNGGFAVADLNNDNIPDIAISGGRSGGDDVWVYLGSANGTYTKVAVTDAFKGQSRGRLRIADMDGDGKPDLVVAGFVDHFNPLHIYNPSPTLRVYWNDGNFSAPWSYTDVATTMFAGDANVAVGDFDRQDGQLDLAFASADLDGSLNGFIEIYRNLGNRKFTRTDRWYVKGGVTDIIAGRFTCSTYGDDIVIQQSDISEVFTTRPWTMRTALYTPRAVGQFKHLPDWIAGNQQGGLDLGEGALASEYGMMQNGRYDILGTGLLSKSVTGGALVSKLVMYSNVCGLPQVPGDEVAPTVQITAPLYGAVVLPNGLVTISATASDNVSVKRVEFYVDGEAQLSQDTTPPYTASWDTSRYSSLGTHILTAVAIDAAGNVSRSQIKVTTDPNVPPPPDNCCPYPEFTTNAGLIFNRFDDGIFTDDNTSPHSIASMDIGDYNNDGILDLVGNGGSYYTPAYVYKGTGDLESPYEAIRFSYPTAGVSFVPGSGDIVGSIGGKFSRWRYLGNDQWSQTPEEIGVGAQGGGQVVADFNKDGRLDVAISGDTGTRIYFADASGNFTPFVVGDTGRGKMRAADIDGDGKIDIITSGARMDAFLSPNAPTLTVYWNNGTNAWPRTDVSNKKCTLDAAVAVGDLDADGKSNDLIFGSSDLDAFNSGFVQVFRYNGNRSFVKTDEWYSLESVSDIIAAPFTCSSNGTARKADDIVIQTSNRFAYWRDYSWTTHTSLYTPQASQPGVYHHIPDWTADNSHTMALGNGVMIVKDLDADGRLDFIGSGILPGAMFSYAGYTGLYPYMNICGIPPRSRDEVPPVIQITAPAPNAPVLGNVPVSATVTDNVGVTEVRIYVDSMVIFSTNTAMASYDAIWNSQAFINGPHVITVVAVDAEGNVARASITVTSDNDQTAPTVAITTPTANMLLEGNALLTADASDNIGVTKVEFYYGAVLIGSDASSPYSITWNTSSVPDGRYSLIARAYDAAGNTGNSLVVDVKVDNNPPTVSITSPAPSSTNQGVVTISANAADGLGIARVLFFVDSQQVGSILSTPYNFRWDTTRFSDGTHTLKARAIDNAGHEAWSTDVNVTVSNGGSNLCGNCPNGDFLASTLTTFPNHAYPRAPSFKGMDAIVADIDHDGKLDFIENYVDSLNPYFPHPAVYFNNRTNPPSFLTVPLINGTVDGGIGLIPETGDIIASGSGGSGTGLQRWPHTGAHTYGLPVAMASAGLVGGNLKIADFDGDGLSDIAIVGNSSGSVFHFVIELICSHNGHVKLVDTAPAAQGQIDVGDFNGDGKPDIVLSYGNGTNQALRVYENNGAQIGEPNFGSPWAMKEIGTVQNAFFGRVAVGDVDGDGLKNDIVWDVMPENTANGVIRVFQNKNGTFSQSDTWTVPFAVDALMTGPFTCSVGKGEDILVQGDHSTPPPSAQDQGQTALYIANGNGLYNHSMGWNLPAGQGIFLGGFGAGDFNDDGRLDFVDFGAFEDGSWGHGKVALFTATCTVPTVAITMPTNNGFVGLQATVSAVASALSGIQKIEFLADGNLIGTATNSPYTINWNTSALTEGPHVLTARATAMNSSIGTSAPVNVIVDHTLPTVSITSPLENDVVTGQVTISASASDNNAIARVEFYNENILIGSATNPPYSTTWNTANSAGGRRALTAKAFDTVGNAAVSAPVHVFNCGRIGFDETDMAASGFFGGAGTLKSGDFDHDGLMDMVGTGVTPSGSNVVVFHNVPGNPETPYVPIPLPNSNITTGGAVIMPDSGDVIASGKDASDNPRLLRWPYSNNQFGTPVLIDSGLLKGDVAFADFNYDGKMDIAVSGYTSSVLPEKGQIWVYLNRGNGNYEKTIVAMNLFGTGRFGFVVRDFDRDGRPDIAYAGFDAKLNVLWNVGNFANPWPGQPVDSNPNTLMGGTPVIAIGDADGDGRRDDIIWSIAPSATIVHSFVRVVKNNGNQTTFSLLDSWEEWYPVSHFLMWPFENSTTGENVVVQGFSPPFTPVLQMYGLNNGRNTGIKWQPNANAVETAVAGADMNLDGRSDLVATGRGKTYQFTSLCSGGALPDETPPLVSISTPTDGSTVNGLVKIAATASDASGIFRVNFYDGDTLIGVDSTAPYEIDWNTAQLNGSHLLRALAVDKAMNVGVSNQVTVTINQPPVVDPGSTLLIEYTQSPTLVNLSGTASDDGFPNPPGALTTTWSKLTGPGNVTFTNASALVTQASIDAKGLYNLVLTADDGQFQTSRKLRIVIHSAPTVNAGPDQSIELGAGATLDGTATDDGLPSALVTTWSKVSGPGTVTFGNANALNTTASFSTTGVYVLRLSAFDGHLTRTDDVTIGANSGPVVDAGPDRVVERPSKISVGVSVTDDGLPNPPGATTISWTKISGPGNVYFSTPNQAITTVGFSEAGTYQLRLSATDGEYSSFDDVSVQVTDHDDVRCPLPGAAPVWVETTHSSIGGDLVGLGKGMAVMTDRPSIVNRLPHWASVVDIWTAASLLPLDQDNNIRYADVSENKRYVAVLTAPASGSATGQVKLEDLATQQSSIFPTQGTISSQAEVAVSNTGIVYVLSVIRGAAIEAYDSNGSLIGSYPTLADKFIEIRGQYLFAVGNSASSIDRFTVSPTGTLSNQHAISIAGMAGMPLSIARNSRLLTTVDTSGGPMGNGRYFVADLDSETMRKAIPDATVIQPNVNVTAYGDNMLFIFNGIYDMGFNPFLTRMRVYDTSNGNLYFLDLDPLLRQISLITATMRVAVVGASIEDETITLSVETYDTSNSQSKRRVVSLCMSQFLSAMQSGWNQLPSVSAGPDFSTPLPPGRVQMAGSVTDDGRPNGTLTSLWSYRMGPPGVTFDDPNSPTTFANFSMPGTYVLRLTANDGSGFPTFDEISVTVYAGSGGNQPPTANAGQNQTITLPSSANLSGSASDDGLPNPPNTLTYTWSKVSGSGDVTFGNANALTTTASFSKAGIYVLRLTVSDSQLSATGDVTITVNEQGGTGGNQRPTVSAGNNQTITLPSGAVVSGSADDDGLPNPPGQLTYAWSKVSGPGPVSFMNPSFLTTTANFSQAGIYVLRLTASDSQLSATSDVTITVNEQGGTGGNQKPTVSAGPNQTITLPASANLSGSADDDGLPNPPNALTYAWSKVSGPGTITFGNATALTTSASFSQSGVYVVRLTANDSELSGTGDATITVYNSNNQAPVAQNQTVHTVVNVAKQVTLVATDPDGDPLSYIVVAQPQHGTLSGTAPNLTYTPASGYIGLDSFTFKANDARLDSNIATVSINVHPDQNGNGQNDPPNAVNDSASTGQNTPVTVTVLTNDSDPDADSLTVTAAGPASHGTVTINSNNTVTYTPSNNYVGSDSFNYTISDGEFSASAAVDITVNAGNQSPVVNAGPDQTIVLPDPVNLSGSATDDGLPNPPNTMTFVWSKVSGPGTVTFGNPNGLTTTANFSSAGIYVLRLTADDSALSGQDDITVTVNEEGGSGGNQSPVANAGPDQTITLPAAANLSGSATDDGLPNPPNALTYAWTKVSGPGNVTFGNATALTTTANFSSAGIYVLRLTANDTQLSGHDEIEVTVNEDGGTGGNQSPSVNAGPNQTITLPASATMAGSASDDGLPNPPNTVTITWSQVSGPGSANFTNVNSLTTTVSFPQAGTYVLRLTADDSQLSSTSDVTMTVNTPGTGNQRPTVNAGSNQTITLPSAANLSGSATDDGLPNPPNAMTYLWTKVSGPGTVTFGNANNLTTTANFSSAGTYVLRLTANDSELSGIADVTITANRPGGTGGNEYPTANAGNDQTITLPSSAILSGSASDDDLPNGTLTTTWSKVSGPGNVTFENVNALATTADFSQSGVYILRLTAFDGELSGSDDVTITVRSSNNNAPLTQGQSLHTVVNVAKDITLFGSDPDGDPLTFAIVTQPQHGSISGTPPNITYTPASNYAGTDDFTYKVNDGQVDSNVSTIRLRIHLDGNGNLRNDPPDAVDDDATAIRNTATFVPVLSNDTDPDGDALTVISVGTPAHGTVVINSNNTLSYTPALGFVGFDSFTYKISDTEFTDTALVSMTVNEEGGTGGNQRPIVTLGPGLTTTLPSGVNLSGSATDDGLPNPPGRLTYAWSKVSGPGTVTFGNASAIATTANFSSAGNYVLRLAANDGELIGSADIPVEVNVVGGTGGNQPPTASAGANQTITLPASANLNGSASDDGLPNPPSTIMSVWTKISGPGTVTFGNENALVTTANFSSAGIYVLRLTVSDSQLTVTSDVTITANEDGGTEGNQKPTANAGPDQIITLPQSANLTGSAGDDGLPNPPAAITTVWSKVSGPGTVTFGNVNSLATTAGFSSAGIYVLRLTVSDSQLSATSDVRIEANVTGGTGGNQPPTANAGLNQSITLPASAVLVGVASDDGLPNPPGAFTVAWSKVSGPGIVAFSQPNNLMTTAGFSSAGTYVLRLTVDDGQLKTTSDVTIVANEEGGTGGNQKPIVSAGSNQTVILPGSANLSGSASDDGLPNPPGVLTTTWSKVSGPGMVTFGNANNLATSADFSAVGIYVLRLTGNDGELTATSDVTVTVNAGSGSNQPPTANAGPNQTIVLPAAANLSGSATDDGLPNPPGAFTVTWSLVTGPGTVTFGNANNLATTANFSAVGVYVLRLTVNDSALSTTSDVTITVNSSSGGNQAPTVNAGSDFSVTLPAPANLFGLAGDDGLPNPPGAFTVTWSKVSGPGTVTFGNVASLATTAQFSQPGDYVLRLTASDSVLSGSDDVLVTVEPAPQLAPGAPFQIAGKDQTVPEMTDVQLGMSEGAGTQATYAGYEWKQISGPTVVLIGADTPTPHFQAPAVIGPTKLVFELVVWNSNGVRSAAAQVTVTVLDTPSEVNFTIYPNPCSARTGATIRFYLQNGDDNVDLTIITPTGENVMHRKISGQPGENLVRWDVGSTGNGGYIAILKIPSRGTYKFKLAVAQ